MSNIYPLVDIKEWCKSYGIDDSDIICETCAAILKPVRPVAFRGYRGIEYSGCEHYQEPLAVVPVGEKLDAWESLKPLLKPKD